MTTEIAIIVMSLCLVVFNKLRMYRKVLVASCFAPRLLVAVAALARLIWMYPVTPRYDRQHELWVPTVISQIQLCLSIATASIPFMVPYFGGFSGNLRRVASAKSTMHLLNEEDARSKSSLWFRRHQKVDAIDLWDLTAGSAVQYERVPKASPRIPSTRPITPLSPPRVQESPKDQARLHGLNIYIPCRDPRRKQSLDLASPRTQSSGVLSPSCTSPHAYLLSSFIPSRKAPTPPVKAYSPRPPTPSSCYSSRSPTPVSPAPDRQRLSLFPSQRLRVVSPRVQYTTSQSPNSKPIRKMRTAVDYSNAMSVAQPGPGGLPARGKFSTRSPRRAQPPKFSIATQLQIPQLSKLDENKTRPRSAQDLTSPMGAAINNWFSSENTQPLPASPSSPSSSSQHLFDQNASSSIGMPRMPVSPSVSHTSRKGMTVTLVDNASAWKHVFTNDPVDSADSVLKGREEHGLLLHTSSRKLKMVTGFENKDEDVGSKYVQILTKPANRAVKATKSPLADVVGFTDPWGRTSCATTEYAHYRLRCLGLVKVASAAKQDAVSKQSRISRIEQNINNVSMFEPFRQSTASSTPYEHELPDLLPTYEAARKKCIRVEKELEPLLFHIGLAKELCEAVVKALPRELRDLVHENLSDFSKPIVVDYGSHSFAYNMPKHFSRFFDANDGYTPWSAPFYLDANHVGEDFAKEMMQTTYRKTHFSISNVAVLDRFLKECGWRALRGVVAPKHFVRSLTILLPPCRIVVNDDVCNKAIESLAVLREISETGMSITMELQSSIHSAVRETDLPQRVHVAIEEWEKSHPEFVTSKLSRMKYQYLSFIVHEELLKIIVEKVVPFMRQLQKRGQAVAVMDSCEGWKWEPKDGEINIEAMLKARKDYLERRRAGWKEVHAA
ncbi:hypothetical protein DDE82_003923 [Stemphylium lycopersici]|nr:hypothetical protein DDE82_003923 [Stemphylium lycopersici]